MTQSALISKEEPKARTMQSRTRMLLLLLAVAASLQVAVLTSMIWSHESTLARGTTYRFRTQPVDPYDAFRGRYVQLGFSQTQADVPEGLEIKPGRYVFVTLETDDDGFARLGTVSKRRPEADYLRLRLNRYRAQSGSATVKIPFDRFYMEEHKAPQAERLYQTRTGAKPAYVNVAVRKGRGIIKDLFIDDMSILERLERSDAKTNERRNERRNETNG